MLSPRDPIPPSTNPDLQGQPENDKSGSDETVWEDCPDCGGSGEIRHEHDVESNFSRGDSGTVEVDWGPWTEQCPRCGGSGKISPIITGPITWVDNLWMVSGYLAILLIAVAVISLVGRILGWW